MQELLDAARVLADQPLPAGPRVAIVGNSGGPEILAADAASDAGLVVAEFDDATPAPHWRGSARRAQNPIDLGAARRAGAVAARCSPRSWPRPTSTRCCRSSPTRGHRPAPRSGPPSRMSAQPCGETARRGGGRRPADDAAASRHGRSLPVFSFPEPAAAALGLGLPLRRAAQPADRPADAAGRGRRAAARAIVDSGARGRTGLAGRRRRRTGCSPLRRAGVPAGVVVRRRRGGRRGRAARLPGRGQARRTRPAQERPRRGPARHPGRGRAARARSPISPRSARPPLLVQPMVPAGTELIVGAVHDAQCRPAGHVRRRRRADRHARRPVLRPGAAHDRRRRTTARQACGQRRCSTGTAERPRCRAPPSSTSSSASRRWSTTCPRSPNSTSTRSSADADGVEVVDARIRVAAPPYHPDPLVRQLRGVAAR